MNLLIVRLLIFGALFWAGLKIWRFFNSRNNDFLDDSSSKNSTSTPAAESLVTCAACGLHLPAKSAIHAPEGKFCSSAHLLSFQEEQQEKEQEK